MDGNDADKCQHCRRRKRGASFRGLCQPCHKNKSIRSMYAVRYRQGRGIQDGDVPCQHCGKEPGIRARGLGNTCYRDKAIRLMYSAIPRNIEGGVSKTAPKEGAQPSMICRAEPGSPAKLQELIRRAAAGEPLWAKGDVRWGADVRACRQDVKRVLM